MQSEISNNKELLSKGICPTCRQPLPADFSRRSEHLEKELEKLDRAIESASKEADEAEVELEKGRGFDDLQKESSRASKEKLRTEKEIESLAKKISEGEDRLKAQKAELSRATEREGDLEELDEEIEGIESELNKARGAERRASDSLSRTQTKVADAAVSIKLLTEEVSRKEKDAARARRLTNYEDWLAGFFRPTVGLIEKQALSQAAARFNEHFQRFFTTLVDDPDMVVRVREDFSPVFEREGFDQDFEALSGGERTSMALAYRFALNAVIRDNMASQPELVVLDEPTDGFSKEQVYKMRSLLEALDSRQVIMVSHEKELESMADHIFRVEKVNGTSKVSKAGP
jgi:exonuclease SbcC